MFETNYKNSIPGYTGHVSSKIEQDVALVNREARKHIPGYGGYLTGVKSENVYGQTYGKISYQSTAGDIQRGIDQPANVKYNSSFKKEFIKHSDKTYETTAQIVGVDRPEDTYKKPIPASTVYKFYGVDTPDAVLEEASKSKTVSFKDTSAEDAQR